MNVILHHSLRYSALVVLFIALSVGCGGNQLSEPSASLNQSDAASEIASTVASADQSSGGARPDPMDSDLDFNFNKDDTSTAAPSESVSAAQPTKTSPAATASTPRRGPFKMVTVFDKFPDGRLSHRWLEKRYEDGINVRHGLYEEYYENGNKFLQGQYADSERTEAWTYWHPNGQVAKGGRYVRGKSNGKWSLFRTDGLLDREENYLAGKAHGPWKRYHSDGKTIVEQQTYDHGKPHSIWTK